MTQLQAINTMLSYVNEMPLSSLTNTLPIEKIAVNILYEEIQIINQIFTKTYTDIGVIPSGDEAFKLEMYMVRRASKSLFTRTIGFEEKGLDVIVYDIKEAMGTVNEVIIDKYLSTEKYYINYINSLLGSSSSIEESVRICKNIKASIDDITVPTGITDTKRYKASILMLNAGSELGKVDADFIVGSILNTSIKNSTIKDILKGYIDKVIDKSSVSAITDGIANIKARFDYSYSLCTSEYITIPQELKERYAMSDLLKDTGGEAYIIDRKEIMKTLARYVYSNSVSIPDYAKNILLSVEILVPSNVSDIDASIKKVINIVEREKEVCMNYGWNYNTLVVTLQPNTDGYIVIPTNYLSVDAVDEQTNVVVSNWKLYDTDNNSFIFDGGVECIVVQDIILDELSNSLYNLVMSKSKLAYAVSEAMNSNTITMLKNEYDRAMIDAKREDAMSIDANITTDEFVSGLIDRTRM